jgi:hypothetical protein
MTIATRVPLLLDEIKMTFEQRGQIYKDNYRLMGELMTALFGDGKTKEEYAKLDLLHHVLSKLTRFVSSDLRHRDSIFDMGVYCIMLTALLDEFESAKDFYCNQKQTSI